MNSFINIPQEEWDLIEIYLDQDSVSESSAILKEKFTQILNVEEKMSHIKNVREGIEDNIKKSKIKGFHKHIQEDKIPISQSSERTKKIKNKTMWYAMAAVLVIIFGIFWMLNSNTSSEKIFAENFKPDIGLPLKMGATNEYGFYDGMLDYKQGNYQEAVTKWEILLKENPENDTLNYFLGVANLAIGDASKSLQYLENQERYQLGIFKEDAVYYAALANIKEGKFNQAKILLEKNPSEKNTSLLKSLPN